eukprot:2426383-Pleurochrysis_carterae.AAC.1
MMREGRSRMATPYIEAVTKESFASIPVVLTRASREPGVQKPVLTRDCMAYLRENLESIDLEEEEEEVGGTSDGLDDSDSCDNAQVKSANMRLQRGRKLVDSDDEDSSVEERVKGKGGEKAQSSKDQSDVIASSQTGGSAMPPGGKRRRSSCS